MSSRTASARISQWILQLISRYGFLMVAVLTASAVQADFEAADWTGGAADTASGTVDGLSVTVAGTVSASWLGDFDATDSLDQGTAFYDLNVGPYSTSAANEDSVGTEFQWGGTGGSPDTGTLEFVFAEPVTNPVIFFERLGSGGNSTSALFESDDGGVMFIVDTNQINGMDKTVVSQVTAGEDSVYRFSTSPEAASFGGVMIEGTFASLFFTVYGSFGDGSTTTSAGSDNLEFTVMINRSPDAVDDSNTTPQDTPLTVNAASGVLSNDSDPSLVTTSDSLSVFEFTVGGTTYSAGATASLVEGALTLNADGSYTFVPAPGFIGVVPTVTYSITDGNTGVSTTSISQDSATLDITVEAGPTDVQIVKTATPDPAAVGDELTYTLTVTNNGPNDAVNMVVTDTLPGGVTWVSTVPSQGSCSAPNGVTCELGSIANGNSATVTIVVTVN